MNRFTTLPNLIFLALLVLSALFAEPLFSHLPGVPKSNANLLLRSGLSGFDSRTARLSIGGGGVGAHYFSACNASLACPAPCGVIRDPALPALRLGAVYLPVKGVVDTVMDYTRAAIMAAWEELVLDPSLSLGSHKPRSFLSTSRDGDIENYAFPWPKPLLTDTCDFADDPVACDMHTWDVHTTRTTGPVGTLALPNAPYDLIMHAQTYEHLFDLNLALQRVHALMAPGAYIFASFPAWNIPHMAPSHQRGLSPCGAYAAYTAAGFEVVRVGWFGNKPFSEVLARPGSIWPNWNQLSGVPDPFTTIPPRDNDLANTVWILGRVPLGTTAPPQPPPLTVDPSKRPLMTWDSMVRVQHALRQKMQDYESAAGEPWPSTTTVGQIFSRFPAWLNDDIANVMLACAFFESMNHFTLPTALGGVRSSASTGNDDVSMMASGASAIAIASAFMPNTCFTSWTPTLPGVTTSTITTPPNLFASAIVTDLFEATVDPLGALLEILTLMRTDASLLISCRSADVISAGRPSLGTCTEYGLQQLLARAGIDADVTNYGVWGRVAYTSAALAEGKHLTFRSLLAAARTSSPPESAPYRAPPQSLIDAIGVAKTLDHISCSSDTDGANGVSSCWAGASKAEGKEKIAATVKIDEVLHALVHDYWSEAKNSWPAIVYVLVKRGGVA